jgi:hypothetical protein
MRVLMSPLMRSCAEKGSEATPQMSTAVARSRDFNQCSLRSEESFAGRVYRSGRKLGWKPEAGGWKPIYC